MKTTNTYGAELLDVMGSDLTVVNAARVSFDKTSALDYRCECGYNADGPDGNTCPSGTCTFDPRLKHDDVRLIGYLARNGHWTPFAHPQLSFRVSAPIFVARQLQKHQIGLAWNEVSRRYVDSEPVIYAPKRGGWRLKASNVKQGSSDCNFPGHPYTYTDRKSPTGGFGYTPNSVFGHCVRLYESMIDQGICPEQARMVLPQSMMTEWVWTGSLAAFARVANQRLDAHAQRECRPVAEAVAKALQDNFPVSWEALRHHKEIPA
jgi:thymidylate synthase (FAD)